MCKTNKNVNRETCFEMLHKFIALIILIVTCYILESCYLNPTCSIEVPTWRCIRSVYVENVFVPDLCGQAYFLRIFGLILRAYYYRRVRVLCSCLFSTVESSRKLRVKLNIKGSSPWLHMTRHKAVYNIVISSFLYTSHHYIPTRKHLTTRENDRCVRGNFPLFFFFP